MALPPEVLDPAISVIATYCATKVPSEHDDMLKIEYKVHGNTITVYEGRPPWREDFGPDWTVDWRTRTSNPCTTWHRCSASSTTIPPASSGARITTANTTGSSESGPCNRCVLGPDSADKTFRPR